MKTRTIKRNLFVASAVALGLVGACTVATNDHPEGWDPKITPGVVITVSERDVCTPGWARRNRVSLTRVEKRQVLEAYGLPLDTKPAEWDHLLPLELGGGNGIKNIWPQMENVKAKDRLENSLHKQVCSGEITLTSAQVLVKQF